jgi:hypothetical protein
MCVSEDDGIYVCVYEDNCVCVRIMACGGVDNGVCVCVCKNNCMCAHMDNGACVSGLWLCLGG